MSHGILRDTMDSNGTDPRPSPRPPDSRLAPRIFRLDGEYWTISWEGQTLRLRDSKGLRYLATLLRDPRQHHSAVSLFETVDGATSAAASVATEAKRAERARSAVTKRIKESVARIRAHHPSLGYHLEGAVKTGATCVYNPDPRDQTLWQG